MVAMVHSALLTFFLVLPVVPQQHLRGTVTDDAGIPIEGVRVTTFLEETITDDEGCFLLEEPAALVRFSRNGYDPLTVLTEKTDVRIILKENEQAQWKTPACGSVKARHLFDAGGPLAFIVPKRTKIRRVHDIDYVEVSIKCEDSILSIGSGPHWSPGFPSPMLLERSKTVVERDIVGPWEFPVAEYRGELDNGTKWRFIGMFGQTASYRDVPPAVAECFDSVMDTLCWVEPH